MVGREKGRGEFALIADLFAPLTKDAAGALGLLDDAALIDVPPGRQMVAAADTLMAGIHFRLDDPPDLVARKALRVNLSDLAAMGAAPLGFLQTLALSDAINDAYLEKYTAGLSVDIDYFGVPLLGGDTTAGAGPFTITIAALGTVEKGQALLRSGAGVGDVLCVTGTIGDSALGLACFNGELNLRAQFSEQLRVRYRLPLPRVKFAQGLVGLATACVDISDGLVADVGHICAVSGVSAVIDQGAVPLSDGAEAAIAQDAKWWQHIFGKGDDYELAFTVSPGELGKAVALGSENSVSVTAIGRIAEVTGDRVGAVVTDSAGAEIQISAAGFRHR